MSGWSRHEGIATALARDNVDTDQLIPARFMSAPRSEGYGRFLLHDMRAECPLEGGASILIAGRNFGCGSSREAAVYALVDAGFRVVIAPSFGDIFAGNAVNNGLLPARADTAGLMDRAPLALTVDLEGRRITGAGVDLAFDIDPVWQTKLINGWDDIDLTAAHGAAIAAFAAARRAAAPWVWPDRGPSDKTGHTPANRES